VNVQTTYVWRDKCEQLYLMVFKLKLTIVLWNVPTVVRSQSWTILNASVVKIYNSTDSLVLFENKNSFFYFEKVL
jgi:hypothetical protein